MLDVSSRGARRAIPFALTLAAALALGACADMSGIAPSAQLQAVPAALPADARMVGGPASDLAQGWWHALGDAQLDRLIAQALQASPSLAQAQARIARQQAISEAAGATLRPQLNGQLDLARQRFSQHALVPPPLAGEQATIGTAQLNLNWELDFFGKNRAALDASLGAVRAAQADALAARVLLASQITRGYVQLARLNDQLDVARRILAQREQTLTLVRDRLSAGLDSTLELRQVQGGLPEARQQIEALQAQQSIARHAIAALAGDLALADTIEPVSLAKLPLLRLPAEIPLQDLAQRADIAAARWRVEAAQQDIKSAKAQFYPNVNLIAFAGLSSLGLGNLVQAGSVQWGVGPALRLPIFDAGRLRANLRGRAADFDAAVASYNGALLDAVRDVADQVVQVRSIASQQAEQQTAQTAAESAYDIARQRYGAGLTTLLSVLSTETVVLNQRRLGVELQAQALDSRVALVRALGGGLPAALPGTTKTIAEGAVQTSASDRSNQEQGVETAALQR